MAPRDFRTRLSRRSARVGVSLADELAAALSAYFDLLTRWNSKINLTALDDPDEAIDRLLLEPIVAARHVPLPVRELMDIGSGGGSPAIPLALALEGAPRLTMVEAKARKSAFLREAVRTLSLPGAIVETARYEELLARPELHERFDLVSLRAVRIDSKVLTTLQAFLRPGGSMVLFRGPTGPSAPETVFPPLEWLMTVPLLDNLQSRLTLLHKRSHGPYVPRGTSPAV